MLYDGGNLGAAYDAFRLCDEYQIAIPDWLVPALRKALTLTLGADDKTSGKNGQHAKWVKQYRSDMIDYARFELIEEFLKHGIPPNKVYEATVIYLEKTHLEANEEALIKAHKRVKVRLKTEPYRYHILKYIRVPSADTAFRYTKERALVWDRILAMRDPDFVDE